MVQITKEEIIALMIERGVRKDRAVMYADAFCEYREASENIDRNGVIVQHPRTSNPIDNPYLKVRDSALKKLQGMRNINAEYLW